MSASGLAETMPQYPPMGGATDPVLDVFMNIVLTRIETIEPENHEFKMRLETDTYWDSGICGLSTRNTEICASRFGTFYFVAAKSTKNPDAETTNAVLTTSNIFDPAYGNSGCLKGDFLDVSMIFHKNFLPQYFPFEAYELEVIFDSFVTANILELHLISKEPLTAFEETLPDGWHSQKGFRCDVGNITRTYSARGGAQPFSRIKCNVIVSTVSESWFLSAFVFWTVSIITNFVSGLGIFASTASVTTLLEQLHARGTYASGAVLAYVFIVPIRPRDLPGLGLTTSTIIFVVGLVCLVVSALYSFVMKGYMGNAMRETTENTRWYHFLTNHEDMQKHVDADEMEEQRDLLRKLLDIPSQVHQMTNDVALKFSTTQPANVSPPPSPPSDGATNTRDITVEAVSVGKAATTDLAHATTGFHDLMRATTGRAFSGRAKGNRTERKRKARVWKNAAATDFCIWSTLHLFALIFGSSVLIHGAIKWGEQIDTYTQDVEIRAYGA